MKKVEKGYIVFNGSFSVVLRWVMTDGNDLFAKNNGTFVKLEKTNGNGSYAEKETK